MRLVSFVSTDGSTRLGVRRDGAVVDLAEVAPELPRELVELLDLPDGLRRAEEAAARAADGLDPSELTLLAPVTRPRKVLCLGLNYVSHMEELGLEERPAEPTVFSKFASCIVGQGAAIRLPAIAPDRVDYEAELAVVIGRRCRNVGEAEALDVVAGYTVANDISARDWQLKKPSGQWLLGKSFDTFLPLGPEFVTPDEIDSPGELRITCTVSGELLQNGNTREMLFDIRFVIPYISSVLTLEAGDVILTGTPSGVGMARSPRRFLTAGDVIETEIEGIGKLVNPVEAAA
jgi:2-keto-4-pentenoate hydratase/2-oxohepta-3-ene-1,7-dioic acid hydratase in catechol pathway